MQTRHQQTVVEVIIHTAYAHTHATTDTVKKQSENKCDELGYCGRTHCRICYVVEKRDICINVGVSFKYSLTPSIPRHAEFICDPEFFYADATQQHLQQHIEASDRQWIYNLSTNNQEEIHIQTKDWILAKDKHPGSDLRFLIVYQDRTLRTIRDLRQRHIPMLMESWKDPDAHG